MAKWHSKVIGEQLSTPAIKRSSLCAFAASSISLIISQRCCYNITHEIVAYQHMWHKKYKIIHQTLFSIGENGNKTSRNCNVDHNKFLWSKFLSVTHHFIRGWSIFTIIIVINFNNYNLLNYNFYSLFM